MNNIVHKKQKEIFMRSLFFAAALLILLAHNAMAQQSAQGSDILSDMKNAMGDVARDQVRLKTEKRLPDSAEAEGDYTRGERRYEGRDYADDAYDDMNERQRGAHDRRTEGERVRWDNRREAEHERVENAREEQHHEEQEREARKEHEEYAREADRQRAEAEREARHKQRELEREKGKGLETPRGYGNERDSEASDFGRERASEARGRK